MSLYCCDKCGSFGRSDAFVVVTAAVMKVGSTETVVEIGPQWPMLCTRCAQPLVDTLNALKSTVAKEKRDEQEQQALAISNRSGPSTAT